MKYNPAKYHRQSIRLRGYDYARAGAYFVTVCVDKDPLTGIRPHLFGAVVNGEMRMNEYGFVVDDAWNNLPSHFPTIALDTFVVMPNHVHGIIQLLGNAAVPIVGAGLPRPYRTTPTLGHIVAYFKYQSTKHINALRKTSAIRVWQRNYHDSIIHDHAALNRIRQYTRDNPVKWEWDTEH